MILRARGLGEADAAGFSIVQMRGVFGRSPSRPGRTGRCTAWLAVLLLCLVSPALANPKYAAIVIDAKTGQTLFADEADAPRIPASLTKMMTLYILFEEMRRGRFGLQSRLTVSKYAAGRPPSKLGLKAGATISVEDAIKAVAVKSSNDIAVVVAESISGSEAAFAARMNRTARAIGMRGTTFGNANGLPHPENRTTARDMALLGRALQEHHPQHYHFFSTRSFSFGKRTYGNTNRLLGSVKGMDGIKTGYTNASGFNLVTSVKRDGRHIIAVVLGGKSSASRNARMAELIRRHLPDATPGRGNAPIIARAPEVEPQAAPEAVAASVAPARTKPEAPAARAVRAMAAVEAAPLPRQRPVEKRRTTDEPFLLGYAQPTALPVVPLPIGVPGRPEPITVAAVRPEPRPDFRPAPPRVNAADPISRRIEAAVEIAEHADAGRTAPGRRAAQRIAAIAAARRGDVTDHSVKAALAAEDSPASAGGWFIQIGAVPSETGARQLLEKARQTAPDLLSSADPFTQRVEKNGATLYRARFAGFADKAEAHAACKGLQRKSFACLALAN